MFKYLLCVLVVVLVFIVAHLTITKMSPKQENFQNIVADVEIGHPDFALRHAAEGFSTLGEAADTDGGNSGGGATSGGGVTSGGGATSGDNGETNLQDYVARSDIERAARASTQKYCPVAPDYNPNDFIKKTEIDFAKACPQMPDLKDYVLKSTIPPIQKCPACICPKVKVSAGMCKECPKPKNNCPKCEPCGSAECRDVIQCAPGDQQVSCPKCPAPQACPNPPEKVCPAFELPVSDIKCPSPKPCALPGMCPDKQGRCPEQPESKCKYYELKELTIPTDDGKPRIVALVTSKAGILWKSMTSEEKSPYEKMFEEAQDKYASLKASYIPVEPCSECKTPEGWIGPQFNMSIEKTIKDEDGKTIKLFKTFEESVEKAISLGTQCFGITQTKRGFSVRIGKLSKCSSSIASWTKNDFVNPIKSTRGRPKTKVEDSDDDVSDYELPTENVDESGDGLEVEECVINGKIYYKSGDGELYDPETSEYIGKYVDGSISLN